MWVASTSLWSTDRLEISKPFTEIYISIHSNHTLLRYWHFITCHGGPRVLSTLIDQQFWILSLRTLIRTVISKCTRSVRVSAVNPQPVMADLPRSRVSEYSPFSRVSIDFAGPL